MRGPLLMLILSSAAHMFVSPWHASFQGRTRIELVDTVGKFSKMTAGGTLLRIRGGSLQDPAISLQGDSGDPNRKPEAMEIDAGSVEFSIKNITLPSVMIPNILFFSTALTIFELKGSF